MKNKNTIFLLSIFFCFFSYLYAQNSSKDLEKRQKSNSNKIEKKSDNIGYIEIKRDRPIDQYTFLYTKFALEEFLKKESNVSFVIIRLDTPGGEVLAASQLAKALQDFSKRSNIPTVAYIDNWAISAGALIAYSCQYIATTDLSVMGAAEPVYQTGGEMKTASEKINSALRAEFKNAALFYERNPSLAEAMVDKSIIVVERNNKIIKLDDEKSILKNDKIISAKDKLLTLSAKDLVEYKVSDIYMPIEQNTTSNTPIGNSGYKYFKDLALSGAKEFENFKECKLITYKNWKVSFYSFLTHPAVISILFFLMMVFGYMELTSPGFGVFGTIAAISLSLILLGSFMAHTINILEVLILLLGIIFLLLEFFVIPGFGVFGVLGIILTLGGFFAITLPNTSFFFENFSFHNLDIIKAIPDFKIRLIYFLAAFVFAFISIFIITKIFTLKILPKTFFVLKDDQKGYRSGLKKENLPNIGEEARSFTPLNPSGKIMLNKKNDIYDAIAENGYINKDENVIISRIEGSKILVKKKIIRIKNKKAEK